MEYTGERIIERRTCTFFHIVPKETKIPNEQWNKLSRVIYKRNCIKTHFIIFFKIYRTSNFFTIKTYFSWPFSRLGLPKTHLPLSHLFPTPMADDSPDNSTNGEVVDGWNSDSSFNSDDSTDIRPDSDISYPSLPPLTPSSPPQSFDFVYPNLNPNLPPMTSFDE